MQNRAIPLSLLTEGEAEAAYLRGMTYNEYAEQLRYVCDSRNTSKQRVILDT
jgi:hypothetical protein